MEMFDEVTKHDADGKKVEDRNTFQQAVDDLIRAHRRFDRIEIHLRTDSAKDANEWFYWLGERYMCEKKVWELFCSGFETDAMIRLYLEFRACTLFRRENLTPNA